MDKITEYLCVHLIKKCFQSDFSIIKFRWTYEDRSWARIAALVPEVIACAEAGDQIAQDILVEAVKELALSVKAIVERLCLCGEGA